MNARRSMHFTKAAIDALAAPMAGERYVVRDETQQGLELLVTATRKSFSVRGRIRGGDKIEYVGIGQYPAISIAFARAKAAEVLGRHATGVAHAQVEKKRRREALTFGDALIDYLDRKRVGRTQLPLKERTKSDARLMIRPAGESSRGRKHQAGELHSIAAKRVDAITGATLRTLFRDLAATGPTRAAYAMRVARAVLGFHGVRLADDPFARTNAAVDRIILPTSEPRDRIIERERLADWWSAAGATTSGDALKLMLLSGMRRGEATTLRCGDVDLAGARIRLEDTKNRKTHVVYPPTQALAILRERMANKEADALIFAGAVDTRKSVAAIVKATGIEFSAHDLRRTFATMAAARLPGYIVKKLLNHISGGDVTAVHYVHPDESTLRAAWQTVADAIVPVDAPVKAPRAGNVVALRDHRRTKAAA